MVVVSKTKARTAYGFDWDKWPGPYTEHDRYEWVESAKEKEQEEKMETVPEYNGWVNYPTWAVYTWITSYEDTYNAAYRIAMEGDKYDAAEVLKSWMEDKNPLLRGGMFGDILAWAMGYVNWLDVVNALRS